jgi:hypothetical protein
MREGARRGRGGDVRCARQAWRVGHGRCSAVGGVQWHGGGGRARAPRAARADIGTRAYRHPHPPPQPVAPTGHTRPRPCTGSCCQQLRPPCVAVSCIGTRHHATPRLISEASETQERLFPARGTPADGSLTRPRRRTRLQVSLPTGGRCGGRGEPAVSRPRAADDCRTRNRRPSGLPSLTPPPAAPRLTPHRLPRAEWSVAPCLHPRCPLAAAPGWPSPPTAATRCVKWPRDHSPAPGHAAVAARTPRPPARRGRAEHGCAHPPWRRRYGWVVGGRHAPALVDASWREGLFSVAPTPAILPGGHSGARGLTTRSARLTCTCTTPRRDRGGAGAGARRLCT